jgi:hypothetical protein
MMHEIFWKSLLVLPTLLGAGLMTAAAIAAESSETNATLLEPIAAEIGSLSESKLTLDAIAPVEVSSVAIETAPAASELAPEPEGVEPATQPQILAQQVPAANPSSASLDQILQYSTDSGIGMSQVTSITQLSDVRPTDWAFQALQSLVERYGCVAGYPDGTFRGNQAMTRYEAAALLNACLDRLSETLDFSEFVTRDDLAAIQRLQEEFAAELATLRGRVDALEARVSELEANQFSTTTKLRGEVIFAISGVFDEDDQFDDQIFFGHRVRLNFDTSFTGEDRLRTRLQARNVPSFQTDPIGFSFGGGASNAVSLDDLIYTFPLADAAAITIGANSLALDDLVTSTISPLDSGGLGSISDFGLPRQYSQGDAGSGAGGGAIIQFAENFSLDFGYVGNEPTGVTEGSGLFNGDYGAIGQLTFLSDFLDAALTFVHAYDASGFSPLGIYQGARVDDPAIAHTYGGQFNIKIDDVQIGGGVAFTDVLGLGNAPDYDVWSYQGTLAINDLGGAGNQFGILAGVPPYTRDLRALGDTTDTGFLTEVYYRFRVNDNIALTPSFIWLADPFNNNDIDDAFIGTLRTTFTF